MEKMSPPGHRHVRAVPHPYIGALGLKELFVVVCVWNSSRFVSLYLFCISFTVILHLFYCRFGSLHSCVASLSGYFVSLCCWFEFCEYLLSLNFVVVFVVILHTLWSFWVSLQSFCSCLWPFAFHLFVVFVSLQLSLVSLLSFYITL